MFTRLGQHGRYVSFVSLLDFASIAGKKMGAQANIAATSALTN
jgi:hypothetical protein